MSLSRSLSVVLLSGLAASVATAQVSVTQVIAEGDMIDGSAVTILNTAYSSGNGTLGFLGGLEDGRRFVWVGNGVNYLTDQFPEAITGGEGTIGVSDTGSWAASFSLPATMGSGTDDSLFVKGEVALREFMAAPGLPGQEISFASRPTMDDAGAAYVVAGYRASGSTSTDGRAFYRVTDGATPMPSYDVIYQSFEVIDGFTVGDGGVDFTYDTSGNGNFLATEIVFNDTPTTADDNMIYLIDTNTGTRTRLAREGDSTGSGDNWDNWDGVSVNNSGDYIIHGDTDGATTADDFLAYNGSIIAREGDIIDGVQVDLVDSADINDLGWIVSVWDVEGGGETVLFGTDSDVNGWQSILSVGDDLDFNNDGITDGVLTDFNVSAAVAAGIEFGNDGMLYLEIDYTDLAGADRESIIGIAVPAPSGAAVIAGLGLVGLRRRRSR